MSDDGRERHRDILRPRRSGSSGESAQHISEFAGTLARGNAAAMCACRCALAGFVSF